MTRRRLNVLNPFTNPKVLIRHILSQHVLINYGCFVPGAASVSMQKHFPTSYSVDSDMFALQTYVVPSFDSTKSRCQQL